MQLHIVHMKRHYTDLMTALADPEGVAVLGFFYEVTIWIACFFKITKSVNYKFRQNEICYFPFSRCPTVQTESMMPLSVLCEPSKTQVGAEVQWKEVKLKRIAIVLMLSLFFPPDANTSLPPTSLAQLIPPEHNLTSFYRYRGSLTTPGCTEAVVWTLFENPIPLSFEQVRMCEKKSQGEHKCSPAPPPSP